jgi:hypothetical protein
LQLERRDGTAAQANQRMNFGIYFYSEHTDGEQLISGEESGEHQGSRTK